MSKSLMNVEFSHIVAKLKFCICSQFLAQKQSHHCEIAQEIILKKKLYSFDWSGLNNKYQR